MPQAIGDGWSQERVDRLKELWQSGSSASQIAKDLGRGVTRNAVLGKLHRAGLSDRARPHLTKKPRKPSNGQANLGRILAAKAAAAKKPPPAVKPPPPTAEEAADALALAPIPEADRCRHHCLWPIGDPLQPGFATCGREQRVLPDGRRRPYCLDHDRASAAARQPTAASLRSLSYYAGMGYASAAGSRPVTRRDDGWRI